MSFNVEQLVAELQAEPYETITVCSACSGVLQFANIQEGTVVYPALGKWNEIPATVLATVERERTQKLIVAHKKAVIQKIHSELEGTFVQAGTEIMVLQHYLSKEEVLERILKQTLFLYTAPERAKYYFSPEVEKKIAISGCHSVQVTEGMPLFVMSRMKREVTLSYSGIEGIIYSVYFSPSETVDVKAPLIGICSQEMLPQIEEVVVNIQCQWEDK